MSSEVLRKKLWVNVDYIYWFVQIQYLISYILFLSQETVLKFHAQAKRWIAYTVISGSLAVVAVTGILVGMYLTGNLSRTQEENNQIAVSNEGLK